MCASTVSSPCPRCHPNPQAPPHILPGSPDALRTSLSSSGQYLLGFCPPPFNHVLLVSALGAAAAHPWGAGLCPSVPQHPLPALHLPALGEQGTAASIPVSKGNGDQAQLTPGAGGACCPASYTLIHIPYTSPCIYCTPTSLALQQTGMPCLNGASNLPKRAY